MNHRIQELALQAGFESVGKLFGQPIPEYAVPLEKFAELIVRECVLHLHKRGIEGFGILEERNLKEHFGVEE